MLTGLVIVIILILLIYALLNLIGPSPVGGDESSLPTLAGPSGRVPTLRPSQTLAADASTATPSRIATATRLPPRGPTQAPVGKVQLTKVPSSDAATEKPSPSPTIRPSVDAPRGKIAYTAAITPRQHYKICLLYTSPSPRD